MIADRLPEHLEVAAALGVLAEDLAFMGQDDMADRARALASRLGYITEHPRHELDFALLQGGAR
ncbi:hypothetical protein [Nocardia spumae]|uniref:hypothetical protein n=1 Tax=Nocardia spumae TaxID=2887190 RepID=UPI001D1434F8|nr:hypothetical protein [Nocardia spumae]